jgi:hypothetical protein
MEIEFRKVGWGDPAFVHEEDRGLFRFHDGRVAFSREHADWALLRTPRPATTAAPASKSE